MQPDMNTLGEPEVTRDDVLFIADSDYGPENVALVTGAASGIGRAVAIALALNGLRVLAIDVDEQGLRSTAGRADAVGARMETAGVNLESLSEMESCVATAARLGQIRYLANVAGIQHVDSIEDFPVDVYDRMQNIMVRAAFYLSKLCIPRIRASADGCGVVANMCSIHAHIATKNKVAYNVAKFGLRGLTQSIAAEGAGKIRAFSVSVGYVRTPLALTQVPEQSRLLNMPPEQVVSEVMLGRSRVKEMMRPIDVANLFVFGFSRHGRYLVGGDLLFDGGVVLTY
jgi:3-hydroxybutyrate dehydrogenase